MGEWRLEMLHLFLTCTPMSKVMSYFSLKRLTAKPYCAYDLLFFLNHFAMEAYVMFFY
ncbi:unnamed protein product [Brassica oleracea]